MLFNVVWSRKQKKNQGTENATNDDKTEPEYSRMSIQKQRTYACPVRLSSSLPYRPLQLYGMQNLCTNSNCQNFIKTLRSFNNKRVVKTDKEANEWITIREHVEDENMRTDSGSCLMTDFSFIGVTSSGPT
jgi:hypothetical protein